MKHTPTKQKLALRQETILLLPTDLAKVAGGFSQHCKTYTCMVRPL